MKKNALTFCLLLASAYSPCAWSKIVSDGLWSSEPAFTVSDVDGFLFTIDNGVMIDPVNSNSRRVFSAQMLTSDDSVNIYDQENVQRVNSILTQEDWNAIFPNRPDGYSYQTFLGTVARFPAFCNEHDPNRGILNLDTLEDACRREIATLLTHIIYESGERGAPFDTFRVSGLTQLEEVNCSAGPPYPTECEYRDTATPLGIYFEADPIQHYYGRGPLHLKWNGKYGQFSKAFFDNKFQSNEPPDDLNLLLVSPDLLLDYGHRGLTSALWYYMTPHFPRPSAHDVVTGFFKANANDLSLGAGNDFGTTIALMAQDSPEGITEECFNGPETEAAQRRSALYDYFITYFGLEPETETGCFNKLLTYGGSGEVLSYWFLDSVQNRCKLVNYETAFSVYNMEDYKRCVCFYWGDKGVDCPQEQIEQCNWSQQMPQSLPPKTVPITSSAQDLVIDLQAIIASISVFPECLSQPPKPLRQLQLGGTPVDFYAFELIKDNQGRSVIDEDFRAQYVNLEDSKLGDTAPASYYKATTLGQTSVVTNSADRALLSFSYTSDLQGLWQFKIHACVDRRDQEYGALDCDLGAYTIELDIREVCQTAEASLYPECSQSDPDGGANIDQTTDSGSDQEVIDEGGNVIDTVNQVPFFVDYDPFNVYEVAKYDKLIVELPQIVDNDEADTVTVTASLARPLQTWVTFDSESAQFTLKPNDATKLGLSSVQITLSDGKDTRIYQFSFFVVDAVKPIDFESDDIQNPSNSTEIDTNRPDDKNPDKDRGETDKDENYSEPDTNSGTDQNQDDSKKQDEDMKAESTIDPPPGYQASLNNNQDRRQPIFFDPNTLSVLDQTREKVLKKQQVQRTNAPKNLPAPISMIFSISGIGEVTVKFNQKMLLDEIFGSFEFSSSAEFVSTEIEEDDLRRNLVSDTPAGENKTKNETIELSSIIWTDLTRGSEETSAPLNMLNYDVKLVEYGEDSFTLRLEFDSPLSVSKGDQPDMLTLTFVEPELFVSQESGKSLEPGKSLIKDQLPKQFKSESSYQVAVVAGSTVQVAANTAFLSQFGVTICLAVSLKAMWNLMHVMQVIAYLRLLVDWPANSNMMLQSMHNAITLENVINDVYNSFIDDLYEADEEKDQLQDFDISYKNWALSLGIFGICLGVLVVCLVFYFMLKCFASRFKCCVTVQNKLKTKLFYSVWIRYMITSNLRMTHNCVFFLFISGSFVTFQDRLSTWLRIVILCIIVIWPVFTVTFLYCKRHNLTQESFNQKFKSMYTGTKTKYFSALMYTPVFCLRRLLLVCTWCLLQDSETHLIYAFNLLQSLYFLYICAVMPHEEMLHNRLEQFNELSLIILQYSMLFFIQDGQVDPEDQWTVGTIVMCYFGFIFAINVLALIYLAINRMIFHFRVKKAKKAFLKVRVRRGAIKLNSKQRLNMVHAEESQEESSLDQARDQSQIDREKGIDEDCSISLPLGAYNEKGLRSSTALAVLDQQTLEKYEDSLLGQQKLLHRPQTDISNLFKDMAEVCDHQDSSSSYDGEQKMTERQLVDKNEEALINPRNIPISGARNNAQLSYGRVTTALGSNTQHQAGFSPEPGYLCSNQSNNEPAIINFKKGLQTPAGPPESKFNSNQRIEEEKQMASAEASVSDHFNIGLKPDDFTDIPLNKPNLLQSDEVTSQMQNDNQAVWEYTSSHRDQPHMQHSAIAKLKKTESVAPAKNNSRRDQMFSELMLRRPSKRIRHKSNQVAPLGSGLRVTDNSMDSQLQRNWEVSQVDLSASRAAAARSGEKEKPIHLNWTSHKRGGAPPQSRLNQSSNQASYLTDQSIDGGDPQIRLGLSYHAQNTPVSKMESNSARRQQQVLHTDSSMDERKTKRTMTVRTTNQHQHGFLEAGRHVLQNRMGTERRMMVGVTSPSVQYQRQRQDTNNFMSSAARQNSNTVLSSRMDTNRNLFHDAAQLAPGLRQQHLQPTIDQVANQAHLDFSRLIDEQAPRKKSYDSERGGRKASATRPSNSLRNIEDRSDDRHVQASNNKKDSKIEESCN